jgi:gas vesicle protein
MNNNHQGSGKFLIGFLFGGFLGTILIFLLGTKEGKQLADKILEKLESTEENLETKVSKLQNTGDKLTGEIIKEAEIVKDKIISGLKQEKQTSHDKFVPKVEKVLSRFERLQKKGIKLTQDTRKKFFKKGGKILNS